jgi:hypothetical protein
MWELQHMATACFGAVVVDVRRGRCMSRMARDAWAALTTARDARSVPWAVMKMRGSMGTWGETDFGRRGGEVEIKALSSRLG